jgi:hypothetical protein
VNYRHLLKIEVSWAVLELIVHGAGGATAGFMDVLHRQEDGWWRLGFSEERRE